MEEPTAPSEVEQVKIFLLEKNAEEVYRDKLDVITSSLNTVTTANTVLCSKLEVVGRVTNMMVELYVLLLCCNISYMEMLDRRGVVYQADVIQSEVCTL